MNSETPRPTIIDRLPTDPLDIEAVPPTLPMPEPLPSAVRPTAPVAATAEVSPATMPPGVETAEPVTQTVRPAASRPVIEQIAVPEVPPAPAQDRRERVIERVVREVHTEPAPELHLPRSRISANSVSKIGALPERRRAFTLFGLRRG
jgi:hypothetical protein